MKLQRLSTEYLVELGTRIKTVRTYLKYDQKRLAQYLRTAASQMSKIEAGKAEPGIYHLLMIKKLADSDDYLRENLTWTWLLEGKGFLVDMEAALIISENIQAATNWIPAQKRRGNDILDFCNYLVGLKNNLNNHFAAKGFHRP
jgi:transcriptional regulator with XRE-family HTH domain